MKKTFNKSAFAALTALILFSVSTLISCGYEPVFYGIMHDVAPEPATINGNITSIARCLVDGEEYFFLPGSGALKYKKASSDKHGDWNTYSAIPFKLHQYDVYSGHVGEMILRVVSDKNYIYMLTTSFTTDTKYGIVLPDTFKIYSRPLTNILNGTDGDWTVISEGKESELFKTQYDSNNGEFITYFNIFSSNSPIPDHREVYFSVSDSSSYVYYRLSGQSITKDTTIGTVNYVATTTGNTKVNSVFYLGNTRYFTDSFSVTTNETNSGTPVVSTYAIIAGASENYNATSKLYTYDGTNLEVLLDIGSPIASLAMTADSVLVGKGSYTSSYTTNGGIDRIALKADGKPQTEVSIFTNNAKYQFTSSYILMSLLCADPTKTEAEACLYTTITYRGPGTSTSASPDNIGLWSYYPSRGNWNRE